MNKYIFAGCLIFFFSKAVNATKDSNISILNNVYFKNFYIIPTYHANMISLDLYPKVKMCIRKTKEGTNIEAKLYTVHCVVYRVQLQEQHGLNTALARATATADGTFTPSTGKRAASRTISVTEPPTPSGLPVISAVRASPPAHHPSGRAQQKGEKRERETGTEERRSGSLTPPPPSSSSLPSHLPDSDLSSARLHSHPHLPLDRPRRRERAAGKWRPSGSRPPSSGSRSPGSSR